MSVDRSSVGVHTTNDALFGHLDAAEAVNPCFVIANLTVSAVADL